ncbi:acyltransferase [uncultured Microbacterium sp.]|uniref:acyltransferase family protein n=1 Tax=uncultured Microbacterium sp. TaxID=191216 RepID=UPI00345B0CBC
MVAIRRSPSQHLLFLDFVRGVSAFLVVAGHATLFSFPELIGQKNFFYVQSWAVVVFLALSGYLITRSVLRRIQKGTFTLSGYVKDRAARILTPLIPLIPVVVLGDRLFLGVPPTTPYVQHVDDGWGAILSNALLLQDNWVAQVADRVLGADISRRSLGTAAPWWTVALEWWVYIAFGCLLAVLISSTRHKVLAMSAGLFALATVAGTTLSGNALILAWVVGALFAWVDPKLSKTAWAGVAVVSAAALLGFVLLRHNSVYSIPVVTFTAVGIFAAFKAASWDVLVPVHRPVVFVADYSYSLYLIHFPILVWMAALIPTLRGVGFLALGFVLSNAIAIVWWFLFERHHRRVRALLR